jgi:hypothetical protein
LRNVGKSDMLKTAMKAKQVRLRLFSVTYLIVRVIVSSVDLFIFILLFSGIAYFSQQEIARGFATAGAAGNISYEAFKLMVFLSGFILWGTYIFASYSLFRKTLGEKAAGLVIKSTQPLLARLFGPFVVSDYLFKTELEIYDPKRRRIYPLILVLLSWWEYLLLILISWWFIFSV